MKALARWAFITTSPITPGIKFWTNISKGIFRLNSKTSNCSALKAYRLDGNRLQSLISVTGTRDVSCECVYRRIWCATVGECSKKLFLEASCWHRARTWIVQMMGISLRHLANHTSSRVRRERTWTLWTKFQLLNCSSTRSGKSKNSNYTICEEGEEVTRIPSVKLSTERDH